MEKDPLLEQVKYNTFYLVKKLFSKKMEPPSVTKSSPYVKTRVDSLIGSGSYSKLFPYSYNETIQIQRPYNISVPKTLLDGSGALSLGALITQLVNYKFNIVLDSKQAVNQETLNLLPHIHGFYFRVLPTKRLYRLKHQSYTTLFDDETNVPPRTFKTISATNYTTDNVADDLLVLQEGQSALLPIEIAIIMDKYSGDLGNLLDNIGYNIPSTPRIAKKISSQIIELYRTLAKTTFCADVKPTNMVYRNPMGSSNIEIKLIDIDTEPDYMCLEENCGHHPTVLRSRHKKQYYNVTMFLYFGYLHKYNWCSYLLERDGLRDSVSDMKYLLTDHQFMKSYNHLDRIEIKKFKKNYQMLQFWVTLYRETIQKITSPLLLQEINGAPDLYTHLLEMKEFFNDTFDKQPCHVNFLKKFFLHYQRYKVDRVCRRQLVENTELMASPLHECSAHEWFSYLPSDLVDFSKKEADDFTSLHYYIMLVYLTMISDTIPDSISEQCQTIIDKLDLIERSVDKIKTTWKKSKHLK